MSRLISPTFTPYPAALVYVLQIRRLDARRYVQELEGKLRELGVDLTALRSQQTDVGEDEEGAIDMKINAEDLQDIKNLDIYQDDFL